MCKEQEVVLNCQFSGQTAKIVYEQSKQIKIGGGPQQKVKLISLEERGLTVWGKVSISGCHVIIEDDLPSPILVEKVEIAKLEMSNSPIIDTFVQQTFSLETPKLPENEKRNNQRLKPFNKIATHLLEMSD
ncbi:hypothetical protein FQA39_LY04674 [Lamprigera yunnana]|nr:hypothetical protein FQA39_LY04674 [Lamprigera yunnana]